MGSATPLTTSDAQEEVSDMDREASVDSITPLSHLEADVKVWWFCFIILRLLT